MRRGRGAAGLTGAQSPITQLGLATLRFILSRNFRQTAEGHRICVCVWSGGIRNTGKKVCSVTPLANLFSASAEERKNYSSPCGLQCFSESPNQTPRFQLSTVLRAHRIIWLLLLRSLTFLTFTYSCNMSKLYIHQMWWPMVLILALEKQRQEDLCLFKACLVNIVSCVGQSELYRKSLSQIKQ